MLADVRSSRAESPLKSFLTPALAGLLLTFGPGVLAQQRPAEASRPAPAFDPAAIRRQAAQLDEFRALLADPSVTVRLLTIRDAITGSDPTMRQFAMDAGLSSNEPAMIEVTLRGILVNTQQMIIEFVNDEGKPILESNPATLRLTIEKFDANTGKIEGIGAGNYNTKWSGQLQGVTFAFLGIDQHMSGSLRWAGETGDFRGRVNINYGDPRGNRNAVWKPR